MKTPLRPCYCLPDEFRPWLISVLEALALRRYTGNQAKDAEGWTESWTLLETLLGPETSMHRWAVLAWFDDAGLLEHGGNIRGSWLTPAGEEELERLQKELAEEDTSHVTGDTPVTPSRAT